MLTEKGSIQTEPAAVESALALYRKKLKLISLIMLIVGAIGVVAYIVLSTVFEKKWIDALLIFAVPFTLGLIGFITITRLHKREKIEAKTSQCEFYADCFFCITKSESGSPVHDKFYYSDALLKSEKGRFGYIYLTKQVFIVPFSREELDEAQLNTVRKLFRRTLPDGAQTVKLEKYREAEEKQNELS